jgi:hypothetical protein
MIIASAQNPRYCRVVELGARHNDTDPAVWLAPSQNNATPNAMVLVPPCRQFADIDFLYYVLFKAPSERKIPKKKQNMASK